MKKSRNQTLRLFLTAILCTMLWGSALPSIKVGFSLFEIAPTETFDTVLFAGLRFFGAGLLILIPLFLFARPKRIERTMLKNALVLGGVQTAAQYFLLYLGLAYTSSVNSSVYNAISTLLYVILAWIIFRDETPSKVKIIGLVVGFSGILLNSLSSQKMGLFSFRGDGFVILSNLCVTAGFLFSKHSVKNADPFLLTGLQMTFGGIILLVIGIAFGGTLPCVTFEGVLLLLYLMAVSAIAFSLWTLLLRDYPSAYVGMFNFLTPIFGAIFSFVLSALGIIDEASSFSVYKVLAILCSAAGILLASLGNRKREVNESVHSES